MHTNFFQYGLLLSFLLSRCFSLSLTSGEVWKLQRSCRSRNLTGYCAAPHQTLNNYPPMKVRPFANSLEKLHSNRASLRSDLCDAGPLLRRSTSGVQCSFLIEHDHGSLVHGRKPLFVGGSIDIYSSLNCRSNKGLVNIAISKKNSGRKGVPDAFPARLKEGRNTFPALFWAGREHFPLTIGRIWCFPALAQTSLIGQCHRNHHVTCGKNRYAFPLIAGWVKLTFFVDSGTYFVSSDFAISMKSVPNVVGCGNLGLIFRLHWWRPGDSFLRFSLFFVLQWS